MKESTRRKIERLVAENVHSMRVALVTAELTKLIAEAAADSPAPPAEGAKEEGLGGAEG